MTLTNSTLQNLGVAVPVVRAVPTGRTLTWKSSECVSEKKKMMEIQKIEKEKRRERERDGEMCIELEST